MGGAGTPDDGASMPPAIVIGADTPIGLTIIRELGKHGVPVIAVGTSGHSVGGASRFTTAFVRRPDAQPIEGWLPALITRHGAKALFAISENDLIELAALPPVIAGCRILTPRSPALNIVLDKGRTIAAASAVGIDVPVSWQPAIDDAVSDAVGDALGEDFAATARRLDYPLAVKWSDPMAVMPMLARHNIAFEKIEYAGTPDHLLHILRKYDAIGRWPLVQSYCPGAGLGQMLLMRGGQAMLTFQHRRLHEWPPSGGVSTLCTNEPPGRHKDQMDKSAALLRHIGWEGPAMVEYRYDAATGRYWLMEVNGRFWGSLPLAHHCGAYFAWTAYALALHGDALHGDAPVPAPAAARAIRACYLIPETRRLAAILAGRGARHSWREKLRTVAGYIRDRFDWRLRYYVFAWDDPRPFFTDIAGIIARISRRDR